MCFLNAINDTGRIACRRGHIVLTKTRIRLKIEIEIGLKYNQSKKRKPILCLVNFALIGQNSIQSQSLV